MRRLTVMWLTAALITSIACTDPTVGDKDNPFPNPPEKENRTGCPEIEFRAPEERCFTLQTFVETKYSPYDVYLSIQGGNGVYPPHIPVAAGGWKHGIVYRSGVKLSITMTVEPSKNGSKDGFCSITDGSQYTRDDVGSTNHGGPDGRPGADVAICILTTNQ